MTTAIAPEPAWVGPPTRKQLLGHPVGLFVLFFTEMWERFSYYGMRGLLKLYMVNYLFVATRQVLQGGAFNGTGNPGSVAGWNAIQGLLPTGVQAQASVVYGWYTGLVYLTPLFGGILADRYLGQRKAVYIGGILMALGQFLLFGAENLFFIGLLVLVCGNGFFKPNISTQVGSLYPPGDPRRDGAFTIFYMGINLGAFICNLICGTLAALHGWRWGFFAAGVGMCLGLVVQALGRKHLAPDTLTRSRNAGTAAATAAQKLTSEEWRRVWALVALCALNVVFWAVYEQQGNTMQTWADEQTRWPSIGGFHVPSTWFQSFNPLFIFIFAPLSTILWSWQAKRKQEPSSVAKMAIGCFILGISFIVMVIGARIVGNGKGSVFWPAFATLLLTIGELYLSPIGLSLVSKVSPARIVSMMMGMWFLSSFFGNLLSGYIGALYTRIPREAFFMLLLVLGVGAGIAIWMFNKPLKRAMGAHAS
jgi:POT family proton-dependent oligopeptide transporter